MKKLTLWLLFAAAQLTANAQTRDTVPAAMPGDIIGAAQFTIVWKGDTMNTAYFPGFMELLGAKPQEAAANTAKVNAILWKYVTTPALGVAAVDMALGAVGYGLDDFATYLRLKHVLPAVKK